jgi:valyl-tRNA synthetase
MQDTSLEELPKTYDIQQHETRWQKTWDEQQIYRYDPSDRIRPAYSIDTPPPYPSGDFHMGNALNWCYFDFVARYKRMRGYNVHFPQGWDCHGLPTEVRAETTYKIRKKDLSVAEFRDICRRLTLQYIEQMKKAMKAIGYSIDWSLEYRTMDPSYYKLTQLSFIMLYEMNKLYRGIHPVNWCPRCETAIAEAEVEYTEKEGNLVYIKFRVEDGNLLIATTRPELLPACVAVAVHPNDDRYKKYIGKWIDIPIFKRRVNIIADADVDQNFGTGVVMICTFGDKTDVRWQKRHNLPIINSITENGLMTEEAGDYKGTTIGECKTSIISDLNKQGLVEKSEKIKQNTGTCWRCHTPVEILSRQQWFMKTREMTDDVIKWTEKVSWVPPFARRRMIDWTTSLDWDWVISRQRIFGTPIPAWTCKKCGEIIIAKREWLPVDPRFEKPEDKCSKCGSTELQGDNDVMDTWMDSSITCAVHAGWPDSDSFDRLFPANLQPNGLDIIRTWDYYLMVKHLALFGKAPYKTVLVNGMVRGTDGRMMHKSYGNYVDAGEVLEKHGADALRQWAAAGGVTGYDIPFRWSDIEYGRKFLTKLWNASRLTLKSLDDYDPEANIEPEPLDLWITSKVENLTQKVTEAFENYQFSVAIEAIRNFTWHTFCDQYLEAIKHRLYSPELETKKSRCAAQRTLHIVLFRILQLLAPICPHIVESIYEKMKIQKRSRSLHETKWPSINPEHINESWEKEGDLLVAVISAVRRLKSEKGISLKTPINRLGVYCKESEQKIIQRNFETIAKTCNIGSIVFGKLTEDLEGFSVEGYSAKVREEGL